MDKQTKQALIDAIHNAYKNAHVSSKLPNEPDEDLNNKLRHLLDAHAGLHRPAEEKDVTILLSDLRGFTSMSEHYSPLEVIDLLNRYFEAMTEVIDQHGGTIDKFMGDSIMVVFGSPEQYEDDLERTLACAVNMQIRLCKMNRENAKLGYPPLYMGIGINSGKVVAGKLGSDIYSEFTVIGDHVNLASRVESYSLRGQILLSEHTFEKAKSWIDIGQVNSLAVKGKSEPIKLYELLAVNAPKHLKVPVREDRKSPRVDVQMPLKFHKITGKAVGEEAYNGEIIDLSYGGMYISSKEKLAPFTEIRFPLSLSISANITSDVYAKVIRINPRPDANHYHLEFSSIAESAEQALKSYIDRIVTGG